MTVYLMKKLTWKPVSIQFAIALPSTKAIGADVGALPGVDALRQDLALFVDEACDLNHEPLSIRYQIIEIFETLSWVV